MILINLSLGGSLTPHLIAYVVRSLQTILSFISQIWMQWWNKLAQRLSPFFVAPHRTETRMATRTKSCHHGSVVQWPLLKKIQSIPCFVCQGISHLLDLCKYTVHIYEVYCISLVTIIIDVYLFAVLPPKNNMECNMCHVSFWERIV